MRKKNLLLAVVAVVVIAGAGTYLVTRPDPAETRYTGAYRFDDGTLVAVSPRQGNVLRYYRMNGETGALWPTGEGAYEGGKGWAEREPVVNRVRFELDAEGRPKGLSWDEAVSGGGAAPSTRHASALRLRQQIVMFHSGELQLRGKLILPDGEGPFPVVVPVHGSESYSAVDHYAEPYLYAAHGLATFVYDKRGTGESEGEYLQNFHVLADDAIAAVRWLRQRPEIDRSRIHLAGFSQGGWIAPLAALKDGGIRSVLIGYGVMVPVTGEDRWGYVHALQQKGFGADAIAKADRVNAVIEDIVDRRQNRWSDLSEALDASRTEPWYDAVKNSDSALGLVASTKLPLWALRAYVWWEYDGKDPPFVDRLYDPVPTLAALQTPSLWILAGQDSSAPAEWTVAELRKLQAQGKLIEYHVYPEAEHGIVRFEKGADGARRPLGFEADYFPRQIEWLRRHSGL